ncbi:MAG: TonB-dependent receptor plug domain-containing protein, partial [Bacteroidales bacterium]|nr:TonB-dependent receptor plug domain-containing protein [Bacteroidales bacterium]
MFLQFLKTASSLYHNYFGNSIKLFHNFFFKIIIIFNFIILASSLIFIQKIRADQESDSLLDTVNIVAPRPDWESRLSPGTVTVIMVDEKKGEQKNLADLLKEAAGVHIREINGRGHYTTVSVRGSTSSQVGIFIDGVLTNLGGDAAVDISVIPIKNVERIEVYRGYIPVRFGGTYMGGVINIVTKKPEKTDVEASLGKSSFGGYQGSIQIQKSIGNGALLLGFNHERFRGDFKYRNLAAEKEYPMNQYGLDLVYEGINYENHGTYVYPSSKLIPYLSNSLCNNIHAQIYITDYCEQVYSARTDPNLWTTIAPQFWDFFTVNYENFYKSAEAFLADNNLELTDTIIQGWKASSGFTNLELYNHRVSFLKDPIRRRLYNAYKNNDAVIKWQNDNFYFKFAWKDINRNMPNGLVPNGAGGSWMFIDSSQLSEFNYSRKQYLTDRDFTFGWRKQFSNLEVGLRVNYLSQDKRYVTLFPDPTSIPAWRYRGALRQWSRYESKRYGFQVDGVYKLGERNLIEFLANISNEELLIFGNGMGQEEHYTGDAITYRPHYDQKIINVQIQDTLTLDNNSTFFLTGSIKFNLSRIFSARPYEIDYHAWNNTDITQTDSKYTWQVALKKIFGDIFTLRATYGTYFRLLNLYEIAGDGAGILPQTTRTSYDLVFPRPEEGTQFDISAILQSKILNADSKIQFTFFRKHSKKVLQLWLVAFDYFSYTNSMDAKIRGFEIEASIVWSKVDIFITATKLKTRLVRRNDHWAAWHDDLDDVIHQTYLPEEQAHARINIRPFTFISLYADLNFTGEMYVNEYMSSPR